MRRKASSKGIGAHARGSTLRPDRFCCLESVMPIIDSKPPDLPISEIYIDETSQNRHQYLVLGGVIIPQNVLAPFSGAIEASRLPELPHGVMKWGKVSRTKLPAYKRVVDTFFDNLHAKEVHFHSLAVDTYQQNHAAFNESSREVGFSKEVYQLGQKFRRLYSGCNFHMYPHRRTTPQPIEELRLILNRGSHKSGDERDWPFRRVHFRKLDDCHPLQIVDIFIGAIAFHLNGHHEEPDASPARKELAAHIFRRTRIRNVFRDTSVRGKFTIWHRKLRSVPPT